MTTLINGESGNSVSVQDRGFQYGDGLFETLAVVNGTPLLWDRHMRRLFHGAARLGIEAPADVQLYREEITEEEREQYRHAAEDAAGEG